MSSTLSLPAACTAALAAHLRPELFQALCEPVRLVLVARLATAASPLTVSEVAGCCGVHLSGVSRHLAVLKLAGVVRAERSGREVRYELAGDELVRALRGIADAIEECRTTSRPERAEKGSGRWSSETSAKRSRQRTPRH
jgi:ArsR family transcriptional regulator, arsenate/arsenite/antimonite-responsive transcriptional repressor